MPPPAGVQLITADLISALVTQARQSPRLRCNHNFHAGPGDNPHRFLNVPLEGKPMEILTRRRWLAGLAATAALAQDEQPFLWPSEPPPDCPLPNPRRRPGLYFTGRSARYQNADTWYPSWAADGNLYSPWTDGQVNGLKSDSGGGNAPETATTGHATILGDSPLSLQIVNAGLFRGNPRPWGGRYPCGSLVHNGVWYYGTYCLAQTGAGLNWDVLGPFVGFRTSRDSGRTWTDTPHTPARPLFNEPGAFGGPVKIGSPHFVDFGRNMQHSPDGKAYLVAHGARLPDARPRPANLSWITGDQVYLLRVEPTPAAINNPAAYEFFAGHDPAGRPRWSRALAQAEPVVEWNDNMGCVTATYLPATRTYLMCVTDGGNTISRYNTYLLEADRLTGPWRMACYLKHFGEQAYFVNVPSKFLSPDGRTFWLLYSANFTNGFLHTNYAARPAGSGYGMCWREVRLAG
jgi:hypothetical protein